MTIAATTPKLQDVTFDDDNFKTLVMNAKALYQSKLQHYHHSATTTTSLSNSNSNTPPPAAWIVAAPGRVNLIGEHTDYTGGYVLPLAVKYCTVLYGTGHCHTSKGNAATQITFRLVSDQVTDSIVEEHHISCNAASDDLIPPTSESTITWINYVKGVIVQYIPDLPQQGCVVELNLAYSSNVPLGAGLSSSASLEVATALFLECIVQDMAYSSSSSSSTKSKLPIEQERAIRCQRAENIWARSPCGIMDQMASSCCQIYHCMLVDCTTFQLTHIPYKQHTDEDPVLVICNSKITHAITADAEYGKRRRECNDAVSGIQSVPLYHVEQLRDANVADVTEAFEKNKLDDTLYRRALHVVTENKRVLECKTALKLGLWDKVGTLMNQSQDSLRDNFEVSCNEIDYLIDIARNFTIVLPKTVEEETDVVTTTTTEGEDGGDDTPAASATTNTTTTTTTTTTTIQPVYGTRLTGGGFGGCTVTLINKVYADALIKELQTKYYEKYYITCDCFVTIPAAGARIVAIDIY